MTSRVRPRREKSIPVAARIFRAASSIFVIFFFSRIITIFRRYLSKNTHRIAIIIPYLSPNDVMLPPYMGVFLQSAAGSKDLIDFLIFHNGQLSKSIDESESTIDGYHFPSNVKFISLDFMDNMADLLLRVIDNRALEIKIDRSKLVQILSKLLMNMPYALIEFKPAYGHIFQHFIPTTLYTHWGYTDFDVMFGDLPSWITEDELDYFDIVTYGYGDQSRVYIRGQFTFHKNNDKINNIWRSCEYLSAFDNRLVRMIKERKFQVQSAEGCYSHAVLERKDIKVKYASKAMTDVNLHSLEHLNGVVLAKGGYNRDKRIIFVPKNNQISHQPQTSVEWLSDQKRIVPQWEIDTRSLIEKTKVKSRCMPWVPQQYQHKLCFEDISSSDNVFFIDGVLLKQPFQELTLPIDIYKTKALFHFQEWKRSFHSSHMLIFQGTSQNSGWVLHKEGGFPIFSLLGSLSNPTIDRDDSPNKLYDQIVPTTRYCLAASKKEKENHVSVTCDYSVSWRDENILSIVSEDWDDINQDEITLVLSADMKTALGYERCLQTILRNFLIWEESPVVILIHLTESSEKSSHILKMMRDVSTKRSRYFIGMIKCKESKTVNLYSLLSMAEDLSKTRWTVSGLNLSVGLTLSKESSMFARRMAYIYRDSSSNAFIIPQLSFTSTIGSNIDSLFSDIDEESLNLKGCCYNNMTSKGQEIETRMNHDWWKISKIISIDSLSLINRRTYEEIAQQIENIQVELSSLFTTSNIDSLTEFQNPPILLIDRKYSSLYSDVFSIIKNRVELPVSCAHGLRLAILSLLQYNILPLPGAFATFDRNSQECHESKCQGCDESISIQEVYKDERLFTTKAVFYSHGETIF